jgi:hypothetical protein
MPRPGSGRLVNQWPHRDGIGIWKLHNRFGCDRQVHDWSKTAVLQQDASDCLDWWPYTISCIQCFDLNRYYYVYGGLPHEHS